MRQIALTAALTAVGRCYNGNWDSTYPYIEVPFILRTSSSEILIDRNYNNTVASDLAIHPCAGGRIKLTARHVRDGICDCCDGSDEAPGDCRNNCAQWEAAIAQRNELITSTMRRLQKLRSDRFDRGVKARDRILTDREGEQQQPTDEVAPSTTTEAAFISLEMTERAEVVAEPAKKSLSEYAKWMLPAKERIGDDKRRNWFSRIWQALISRTKAKSEAPKPLRRLSDDLRNSPLAQHPEWLHTADVHGSEFAFTSGEKTYTLENLLSLSMRENWQHLRPSYGKLSAVEIVDMEKSAQVVRPRRFSGTVGPIVLRFEGGSQCSDRYYSDEQDDWVVKNDVKYSGSVFTVCGEVDQFLHVEFQKPCHLLGVLESPAACVSARQAIVETMPSGKGRRNEL